ncbi:GAK8 protein, partial [Podargus strigoides]|nr:GAK8 protein [Podargus strigoides]
VHELGEWRRLGDRLWELVLAEDKTAKKMSKLWKVVQNELLMCQAEKRAAEEVKSAQERNRAYDASWNASAPNAPNPPVFRTVTLPAKIPSAPPAERAKERDSGIEEASPQQLPRTVLATVPHESPEPVPGAESDLAEAVARERRELWAMLARQGLADGDGELVEAATSSLAFPVVYTPIEGGLSAEITNLDWKMLAQLRATVGQYGVTSEPVKQMIDYLFNVHVLLPSDIKGIARLIYTPHQSLLFYAHWQQEAIASVNIQRGQGDPLAGITIDELMGLGAYSRIEAQALSGPEKCREIMLVAKKAMDKVKAPGGIPIYMGIKQGRDEALGLFIDKVMEAITKAGVPEYMHAGLLKQCVLQNGNSTTKALVNSMPGSWGVPDLLEKAATIPTGQQAFLVNAIQKIGEGLQEQAKVLQEQAKISQNQVMAALAPLQAAAFTATSKPHPQATSGTRIKCFRCGNSGHLRRECVAVGVWCGKCQSNTHNSSACRRRSGNPRSSASSSRAGTQVAAAITSKCPNNCNQPPAEASAWTWQPQ